MIKNKNKKGAIELSMTTIIVIIIGITLLSLGLMWIKGVFEDIGSITDQAFINADKEIKERMGENEVFYISGQNFEVEVGKKLFINVGIRNTLGVDSTINTIIAATDNAPLDRFTTPSEQEIKAGESKGYPILYESTKTAVKGNTHFYTIKAINNNGDTYGSETITITIV